LPEGGGAGNFALVSTAVTQGIRVTVKSRYLPEQSGPGRWAIRTPTKRTAGKNRRITIKSKVRFQAGKPRFWPVTARSEIIAALFIGFASSTPCEGFSGPRTATPLLTFSPASQLMIRKIACHLFTA